eukprot:2477814-Rhodomonas_salina.2
MPGLRPHLTHAPLLLRSLPFHRRQLLLLPPPRTLTPRCRNCTKRHTAPPRCQKNVVAPYSASHRTLRQGTYCVCGSTPGVSTTQPTLRVWYHTLRQYRAARTGRVAPCLRQYRAARTRWTVQTFHKAGSRPGPEPACHGQTPARRPQPSSRLSPTCAASASRQPGTDCCIEINASNARLLCCRGARH